MTRFLGRLLSLIGLAYVLGYAAFALLLPRPAGDQVTEAIVVLTGGSGRLDRGFTLLKERRAQRMLISGVERTVRPRELAVAYQVPPQLFACCIDLGREAFDTRSNAEEVDRWLDRHRIRSIRLVTNDIHMSRAVAELRQRVGTGVSVLPDAVPTDPSLRALFIEYNKYLLGRLAHVVGI